MHGEWGLELVDVLGVEWCVNVSWRLVVVAGRGEKSGSCGCVGHAQVDEEPILGWDNLVDGAG